MIPEHLLDPGSLGDHVDRLYRAAWALCGSREEAEDLVQETYAKVLSRPRLLRNDDDAAYLVRALRNTFVSQRRRRIDRATAPADFEGFDPVDPRSGTRPEEVAEQREVLAAISGLPDGQRDVLVAVDVAGLSYREAARALGIREATVTSRLYRARQRVARMLAPDTGSDLAAPAGEVEKELAGDADA